uniref:Histidine--tRNA ligase, chloroplastic n=1 Tax=Alsidium seaforthii TaxID=2007182 RepID=A0A1Z1MD78_9FLOR|nr:Histidine-tRNA ligase [Bryothamnion seaforthii]ARW64038.1 Histidine-tRNA ligase [Bryothamnion seaforthii]
MQPLRGVKDILPYEIQMWQEIYSIASNILKYNNYHEIRTPILENTELFRRSIGNFTDIVNKEMYSFHDQGERNITLRPEGTASIARAFISNKLYKYKKLHRLWYMGPMFRYERPQKGRQRQFHQLGIECIGSDLPIADVEVIRLAIKILESLKCKKYQLQINCIGNINEREEYKIDLINYLEKYYNELDQDSQKRLKTNPLRILDSKNKKTQTILIDAPKLKRYLKISSRKHFEEVCKNLSYLKINYSINDSLVRGLDYYNYTAFEIKTLSSNQQNTICGGGRYDNLIEQIGGPNTPSVGWAIGIERLIMIAKAELVKLTNENIIYIANQTKCTYYIWDIIGVIEKYKIPFNLDLSLHSLHKQLKRANQTGSKICFIVGEDEIKNRYITVKWLATGTQQQIYISQLHNYLKYLKQYITT